MIMIILEVTIKDGALQEGETSFTHIVPEAEEVHVIRSFLKELNKHNQACPITVNVRTKHGKRIQV